MRNWLVKVRRYGGGESVVGKFGTPYSAQAYADSMNEAYHTDSYYVEQYSPSLSEWPTMETIRKTVKDFRKKYNNG